jgi:hypothetical protein
MSRLRRGTVALICASALAGSALGASPANAAAPGASADIVKLHKTIRADAVTAEATVTYRCTNDSESTYYLRATLSDSAGGYYGRGDTNSSFFERLPATCTGKKVTETIVLYSYLGISATQGEGSFALNLYNLAPPPGSFYGQPGAGPEDFASGTVRIVTAA